MIDQGFTCQLLLSVVQWDPSSQASADLYHDSAACVDNILFNQMCFALTSFGISEYNRLQQKKKCFG